MIVTTVRTRDEEENIGPFCEAYQGIADKILVADGGSEDDTLEIASSFPNVEIRHFDERTELANDYWRNNDSRHINFCWKWAEEHGPDWIIHDDCDSRPNALLRKHGREILEFADRWDVVMTCRVYLYGEDHHFPNMMKLKPVAPYNWMTSLWAWRPEISLWTDDLPPAYTLMVGDRLAGDLHVTSTVLDLFPPYCLLHYTWSDEEKIEAKIKMYRESGLIPDQLHPMDYAGPLENRPEWAHE